MLRARLAHRSAPRRVRRAADAARPRSRFALLFAALAAAAAPLAVSPAEAQNLFAAVAKVNDDIITGYDVLQRAQLLRFASGRDLPDAERLALDSLVEDALKIQEAERRGLTLSATAIAEAVGRVASSNRMSADALTSALNGAGVEPGTLERQIRADLLWRRLVSDKFGERMRPSDGEIDAALEQAPTGGPRSYDLRQIVVALAPSAPQAAVVAAFTEAERVRGEMKDCSAIERLAPRYAPISGKVGDLTEAQMPPPVRAEVVGLSVGGATKPVRSRDGVHVIMLCGVNDGRRPSRDEITSRLVDEKGQRFAESYLAELRRDALIESRR